MKYIKGLIFIGTFVGIGILYKTYEDKISCMCKKMMKKELNMIENGLDID